MLDNFKGLADKEVGYKLAPDGTKTLFRFSYEDTDINTVDGVFLSNLHMSDTTIVLKTSKNLNWLIGDVILIGEARYQIQQLSTAKRKMIKTSFVHRTEWDYILVIGA